MRRLLIAMSTALVLHVVLWLSWPAYKYAFGSECLRRSSTSLAQYSDIGRSRTLQMRRLEPCMADTECRSICAARQRGRLRTLQSLRRATRDRFITLAKQDAAGRRAVPSGAGSWQKNTVLKLKLYRFVADYLVKLQRNSLRRGTSILTRKHLVKSRSTSMKTAK